MATSEPRSTILVIDDERGPRESLRILLKKTCDVLCAESVDLGIEFLQQAKPDAIIMDIRMPGKTGIDGLREIREIDPIVSVIMLTGFGALETAQEAIRLGANDYLKKPFDAVEMEDVIVRNVKRTQIERRRWAAEQQVDSLNQQLQEEIGRKDHLAELGQKSAELVHDLRNPLAVVLGYVELLAKELKASRHKLGNQWQETSEYIGMIERSVNRCRELSDLWLSLSRRDPNRMRPVRLKDLLVDIIAGLAQQAESHDVQLKLTGDGMDHEIQADQLQLFRALHNVLVNAIEATSGRTGDVCLSCREDAGSAELCISDNGCGMQEGEMHKAFDPYFTRKLTGTGLGLFITKKVIEEHKGEIRLESKPGEGTKVLIRLPLLERPAVEELSVISCPNNG